MSIAGTVDAPLELFGGLASDVAAAELPAGVSPDCQDVIFSESSVRTRPGLQAVFAPLAGNPTVNYLKTYNTLNQTLRLLALDSAGTLYKETAPGVLGAVASGLAAAGYAHSATLFGREYLAISDGKIGNDIPRQYDDTDLDRVSQVGPGAAPFAALDAIVNIASIARSGNVVTVVTQTSHLLQPADQVVIAGVTGGTTSFNGTFPIALIINNGQFTYNQTGPDESGNPNTGTENPLGVIAAGARKLVVIFKTRQGYLTAPSPAGSWTAAGGRKVLITGIPTGPANVTARVVAFTAAGGASYYHIAGTMIVEGNTNTLLVADFSEAQLLAATNVDYLFRLVELGPCAGVIDYAQRLFWWGERNKANNWLNLTFDGGFSGSQPPYGWTQDATLGAGGSKDSTNVIWGDAYRITGNGVTATRGLITQPAVKDANGVALIAPATEYSVRARVRRSAGLVAGTLRVQLFGTGVNTAGLQITAAQAGTSYAEFTAQLTPPLATIPTDLALRVYADGTPTNNEFFVVDNIEIFPAAQPAFTSLVRASRVSDPESYDGIHGFLQVAQNNGQAIRAAFKLREHLYFVKEHSLYVTRDDGVNEPSLWTIEEVSRRVGTPSVRGVGVGEGWVVIAHRSGLYLFWGGEPVKISQEIQPLWNQINWQYGHTLWVAVDTKERRILVGAPMGTAITPNRVLVLDYRDLDSAEQIAARPPIHITPAGRKYATDKARKWAPWNISANAGALVERSDGTAQMFFGNGGATGKVYQLNAAQLSDDGAAIASYYTTYFMPQHDLEERLELRAHRKLFAYLTLFVEGSGLLSLTAYLNSAAFPSVQASLPLSNPGAKDLETPLNLLSERVAFKVGTSAVGSWFRLQKFTPSLRPDPWAPVRGTN